LTERNGRITAGIVVAVILLLLIIIVLFLPSQ
jgi:hypothetical protein